MKRIKVPSLKPVGAYSSAVSVWEKPGMGSHQWIYLSGVIGINFETGKLEAQTFEEEAKQVMEYLKTTLEHLDADFEDVVKATVFLTDMDNFGKFNEIYSRYFEEGKYPAREVVEVRRLPKDVNVEVSMVVYKHVELEDKIEKMGEEMKQEMKEKLKEVKGFIDKLFD